MTDVRQSRNDGAVTAAAMSSMHEHVRLQPLDRLGRPQQRYERCSAAMLTDQAPQHAMRQRLELQEEQRLRPQQRDAERAVGQQVHRQPAGLDDPGQQQRVGPHRKAGEDAGDGAARRRPAPDQPAEERGRQLRDGGKRHQADGAPDRAPAPASDRQR